MRRSAALMTLLVLLVARVPGQARPPVHSGIRWAADYDAAFKAAREKNRPIMFSIMITREKGCRAMIAGAYKDPRVIEKSRFFINLPCCPDLEKEKVFLVDGKPVASNPLFPGVSSRQCRAIENRMRAEFLKSDKVIAPQHIFVSPEGKIILRKEYQLSAEELLALMERVRRKHLGLPEEPVPPESEPGENGGEGPKKDVSADGDPAEERLSAEALRLLRLVVEAPLEDKLDAARKLMEMKSPLVDKAFVDLLVHKVVRNRKIRFDLIREVGNRNHAHAAEEFTRLLDQKDVELRNAAVVTLEEMAAPDAVPALLDLYRREKDPIIRKDVIQALGPCGATEPALKRARPFLLEKLEARSETQRAAAAMALGAMLAGHEDVQVALERRFKKEKKAGRVKLAVLWAFLQTRDQSLAEDLEALVAGERNTPLKNLGRAVVAVMRGEVQRPGRGGRRGRGAAKNYRKLWKMFEVLFKKDRIERKLVRDLRRRFMRR